MDKGTGSSTLSSGLYWPLVSEKGRNGKENGHYYDGFIRITITIHSFIPSKPKARKGPYFNHQQAKPIYTGLL